jgi:hypothetical protein
MKALAYPAALLAALLAIDAPRPGLSQSQDAQESSIQSSGQVSNPVTINVGSDTPLGPLGWTDGVCYPPITEGVSPGDEIVFDYAAHNVYLMASEEHYHACDFSDATLLGQVGESPYTYTVKPEDEGSMLYFACQVGDHCAGGNQKLKVGVSAFWGLDEFERVAPASTALLGKSKDECDEIQKTGISEADQIEASSLRSYCSEPVLLEDEPPLTYYRTCLSGPATLTPGGVINRLFVMQDPFPQDYRVVIGQRTFEFVSGDPDSEEGVIPVPVNELYVHHLSGSIVFGQGSEGIRQTAPDAPFPEPYSLFSGEDGNSMIFHLIDLREVDEWLACVECRCSLESSPPGTYLDELQQGNITGGVNCCTNCTDLEGPTVDYRMRYNITYREMQPDDPPILDVHMLTADISPMADSVLEHDVPSWEYLPPEQVSPENPKVQRLEIIKPFNQIFKDDFFRGPYSGPENVQLLRCVAHLHIAAKEMWLEDYETGERLCDGQTTYGTDPDTDKGFLTAVSVSNFNPPKEFPADLMVRFVTDYDAEIVHTGVMGYWFVFTAGDGQVTAQETSLTVDLCLQDTCDASMLPQMDMSPFVTATEKQKRRHLQDDCVDTIADSPSCTFGGICDCETFVNAPETTGGCNGFFASAFGDIEVRSLCANHCGCEVTAAVDEAVASVEEQAEAPEEEGDENCVDSLDTHPACTMGGVCDCETFVNSPESTGCGGVFASSWGDTQIDSVCNKYCGCGSGTASEAEVAEEVDESCVNTIDTHPTCTLGGICECEAFVSAPESTGCGGVYTSPFGDIQIDSLCNKYCGCNAVVEAEPAQPQAPVVAGPPAAAEPSLGGLGECQDTLPSHPACRFGGVCTCQEFVSSPESEGCGGLWKSEMGDTVINDVCALYCNACVTKSVDELFEEAYSEVLTLAMKDHCRYASAECETMLSNLYSCGSARTGIDEANEFVKSFVTKHGQEAAKAGAKLGSHHLHAESEDQSVEVCGAQVALKPSDETDNTEEQELEIDLEDGVEAKSAAATFGSAVGLGLVVATLLF